MDGWSVRIVVLDRGFVKVCECPDPEGYALWLPYRNGRTIRRWGTANGLSELLGGPLENTVLDTPVPTGKLPVRAIIDVMDADQSWLSHLTPALSAAATRRSESASSRTTRRNQATV